MTGEEAALPTVTEPITELTLEMRRLYLVTTRDSTYEIDLRDEHHQTVLRIPGPTSSPTVSYTSTVARIELLPNAEALNPQATREE
jgi:hypothetical protein